MAEQKKPVEDPKTRAIRRYINEKITDQYLADRGASGCGIGEDANGESCLNLYIDKQQPAANKVERPKTIRIDQDGESFDVPVHEVAIGSLRLNRAGLPGSPIHLAGGAGIFGLEGGTLGGWAWDKDRHTLVFLSNHHVLGAKDTAIKSVPLDGVPQPFGTTLRGHTTLDGKPMVDCAIGTANQPNGALLEVLELGAAIMETGERNRGDKVQKSGNSTGVTTGTIKDPAFRNNYPQRSFFDCLLIDPANKPAAGGGWALQGDSGSLVVSAEKNERHVHEVIGVHVGTIGEGAEEQGVACRIEHVFKALSITTLPHGVLAAIVASAVGDGDPAQDMLDVLSGFRQRCATSDVGKLVLDVIEENRTALVTLLATSRDLREEAAAMFASMFANAERVEDVVHHPLDVTRIRNLGNHLASAADNPQQVPDAANPGPSDRRALRTAIAALLIELPGATTLDALMPPHGAPLQHA